MHPIYWVLYIQYTNILDIKWESKFSVGKKFWPCEGEVDSPFRKSILKLLKHLPCQTSLSEVGRREGLCKPEVPVQEQLRACLPPLKRNNREFELHPRKQRTCKGPDGVLQFFSWKLDSKFWLFITSGLYRLMYIVS